MYNQKKLDSTVLVIANAIENDTDSLRALLLRNGALVTPVTSKGELQKIVTSSLKGSATFRKEFSNWVAERSGIGYSNAAGDVVLGLPGIGGMVNIPTTAQTVNTKPAEAPKSQGFWSNVSLNSLLDFAKDGMNNYVDVVKSSTDKAIVDSALERERLALQTGGSYNVKPANQSNTTLYVVLGLLAVAGIGTAIYFATKKK